mmetsp:Transcript_6340/g.7799  ORF Transcript_6340/g.7799 Transcript_6340/m.7799 type:complete len:87 (+) Transcript_6340:440-700(+)
MISQTGDANNEATWQKNREEDDARILRNVVLNMSGRHVFHIQCNRTRIAKNNICIACLPELGQMGFVELHLFGLPWMVLLKLLALR